MLVREGALVAQTLDLKQNRLVGSQFEVHLPGESEPPAVLNMSLTGVGLVQFNIGNRSSVLAIDRKGRVNSTPLVPQGRMINLALSPDGTKLLIAQSGESLDIWLHDLNRAHVSRFTAHPAADGTPVWRPDGSLVAFSTWRDGTSNIYVKGALASGSEQPLVVSPATKYPTDWSADGQSLMYQATTGDKGWDLWVVRVGPDQKASEPKSFIGTEFNERDGRFSPDVRWVAYTSDESGRNEVYVQSFPAGSRKWQVSRAGGGKPVWRRDGRELYYLSHDGYMMAVPVTIVPSFEAGEPQTLFAISASANQLGTQYAVNDTGETFFVMSRSPAASRNSFTLLMNWRPDSDASR
jgi:dipeptidyl aminopeptidase/acylaminoacyl peptidase